MLSVDKVRLYMEFENFKKNLVYKYMLIYLIYKR